MTESQAITGVFRYKHQNFAWNLALSSSILVGGGLTILLLLYNQPLLALVTAIIALTISGTAILQIRKQLVTLTFDGQQLKLLNQRGNIPEALSTPFRYEVRLRKSTGQERTYLQCVIHADAIIVLEEKIPDGQSHPPLPILTSAPPTSRYLNTKPFPDALWSIVQTLGLPENPLIHELMPPTENHHLFEQGKSHFAQYETNTAIETFSHWIEQTPDDPIAYHNRGVLMTVKNLDSALKDFSQAIQLNEQFAAAYHQRAKAYAAQNHWELVLQDAQTALALSPDAELYNLCGVAFHALNQPEQALVSYTKAVEIDPHFTRAYHNRALLYQKIGDAKNARQDFERAKTLDPTLQ